MIFSCREMAWEVDLILLVRVWVGIKQTRGSKCLEICIFESVLDVQRGQGQRLRDWERWSDGGKEELTIFSCRGVVWGVDLIHLV